MKKHISVFLLLAFSVIECFGVNFSDYKGVWADDAAEDVVTDSVCILYESVDSAMQATLEIPGCGYRHQTTFAPNGEVSFSDSVPPLDMERVDGKLRVGSRLLAKVEDIVTTEPYEMRHCASKFDVGNCLQEWRLGVKYGEGYCEVVTNRHMFVYMVNPAMVYIRAAATRNNDNGTLFFQNIRMMKNANTGEYTMHMPANNLAIARADLEIDNSKFNPAACTFSPDGGIYWSLISFTPDEILLNGCGETYTVPRPSPAAPLREWIKFVPY